MQRKKGKGRGGNWEGSTVHGNGLTSWGGGGGGGGGYSGTDGGDSGCMDIKKESCTNCGHTMWVYTFTVSHYIVIYIIYVM